MPTLRALLFVLLAGCAQAQVAAPEPRVTLQQWADAMELVKAYCERGLEPTLVAKEERCQDYLRRTYAHYGRQPGALREAEFAYRLAILARVDRGELDHRDARFLIAQFRRELEAEAHRIGLERRRLEADERAADAAAAAAFTQWYSAWSQSWGNLMPRTPVVCTRALGIVTCQ